ncbi:hypothetical protein SNE40_012430 [Patella caerulea]|uniref:Gamma-tubulin complex component 6 n=2 Tax=Patella caerulea TaxID=87958 RepID=A0AAN8JLV5_PATCE
MAEQGSVIGLFNDLCKLHLRHKPRAYLVQPQSSKEHDYNSFRRKLYNTLFDCLKDMKGKQKLRNQPVCKEVETVLCYAFNLRLQRRFDDASRLEQLLEKVLKTNKDSPNCEILSVLTFITLLTDSRQDKNSSDVPVIGYNGRKVPIVYADCENKVSLPDGPLCYGDSQMPQHDSLWYMHYPRHIFETKGIILKSTEEKKRNIFELTPGSSLSGNGLFSVKGCMNDEYERTNTQTLFGALVQSKTTSLDVKLEIPDFKEDGYIPEIKIPKTISSSQLSEDEGFVETKSEIFSSTASLGDSFYEDDNIWERALHHTLNKHHTWERVGLEAGTTEQPYLTEAGSEACNKLWLYKTQQISLLFKEPTLFNRIEISQQEMAKDVLNLMIGVQSTTFIADENNNSFHFKPGVYVSGITSEALESFLSEFMDCGTTYKQLESFSKPLTIDSFYEAGLVFQAFTTAIRKVLQYYRGIVLNMSQDSTLMEIKYMCHKILNQQDYLLKLCQYRSNSSENAKFPKGIELISYLYQETLETNCTDNYPVMLSILQTTCAPFTIFLQNWVFHGIFQDLYGEFTIQVNHQLLESRDRQYWTSSYTMTSKNIEDCVPIFLSSMASDIINCGKTLNLLKLCYPDHFMCNISDKELPRVTITFSEEELRAIYTSSQMYTSRMKQIARQVTLSRKENQRRIEQAKQDMIGKANTLATKEMIRIQTIVMDQKKAEDTRKRQEFQRLKDQMKEDLQRRATTIEDTKADDKQYMDAFTKRELAMTEEEKILEEQARQEVIAHYAELSEEATRREQKALWKVRRARLDLKRTQFLIDDADFWEKEIIDHEEARNVLKDTDVELPQWAKTSTHSSIESIEPRSKWNDRPKIETLSEEPVVYEEYTEKEHKDVDVGDKLSDVVLNSNIPGISEESSSQGVSDNAFTVDGISAENSVENTAHADTKDICKEKESETPIPLDDKLDTPSATTPVKTSVKLNESISATSESEPSPEKYHVQLCETASATKETTEFKEANLVIKMVSDKHTSLETVEEETQKVSVKMVDEKHSSKESKSVEEKSQIRTNPNFHPSIETDISDQHPIKKLMPGARHASDETQQKEWKVKLKHKYGHVSEMSKESSKLIPRLKPTPRQHFSFESNFKDYGIKPKIRISKNMSVNKRSDETDSGPKIRTNVNLDFHPSKQSTFVDRGLLRSEIFKERNVYGHSSDSSVQKLLYAHAEGRPESDIGNPLKQLLPAQDWPVLPVEPFDTEFDFLMDFPKVDLMSSIPFASLGSFGNYGVGQKNDVEKYKYLSLPSVLKQSMMTPLKAQISLVNKSVIDYFFVELKMENHFEGLRRYLFMEDGDFSQILSDTLFDKLATNPLPQEMLNPVFLNGVLKKSLQSSMQSNDKIADKLSFVLKFIPSSFQLTSHDTLDCLELQYKVDWPINIVLTDGCMSKYGLVFSFMMQLKRIVWVLKDVWYRLKRDSLVKKAGNSPQFRHFQLFRQEMQHFVKVMQGYIANQVIHVTWQEFQDALNKDVGDLDDLYKVHGQYLEKAIFRCLLNKKAKPVMKIIQDIFSLILKFRIQLLSGSWKASDNSIIHSNFQQVSASYKAFRQYSVFLFDVVNKLAIRGYQPHLQELLLRLNFNNYYKDQ